MIWGARNLVLTATSIRAGGPVVTAPRRACSISCAFNVINSRADHGRSAEREQNGVDEAHESLSRYGYGESGV
jgi:hypothetical protein